MAAAAQTHHGAFGQDSFGRFAERVARFFGTPQYIVGQTIVVICWIAFNTAALGGLFRFDPEPYILLNLVFSTQAAYAAPLILLAQNVRPTATRWPRTRPSGATTAPSTR